MKLQEYINKYHNWKFVDIKKVSKQFAENEKNKKKYFAWWKKDLLLKSMIRW